MQVLDHRQVHNVHQDPDPVVVPLNVHLNPDHVPEAVLNIQDHGLNPIARPDHVQDPHRNNLDLAPDQVPESLNRDRVPDLLQPLQENHDQGLGRGLIDQHQGLVQDQGNQDHALDQVQENPDRALDQDLVRENQPQDRDHVLNQGPGQGQDQGHQDHVRDQDRENHGHVHVPVLRDHGLDLEVDPDQDPVQGLQDQDPDQLQDLVMRGELAVRDV